MRGESFSANYMTVENGRLYYCGLPVKKLQKDDYGRSNYFYYIMANNSDAIGMIALTDEDFKLANSYIMAKKETYKPADKEVLHTQLSKAIGAELNALDKVPLHFKQDNAEPRKIYDFETGANICKCEFDSMAELICKAVNERQKLLDDNDRILKLYQLLFDERPKILDSNRELLDIAQKIFDDINDKKITAKSGIVPDSYVWHKLQTAINNAKQINK